MIVGYYIINELLNDNDVLQMCCLKDRVNLVHTGEISKCKIQQFIF